MAGGVVALASSAFLAACSTFGVRSVEEPPHQALARVGAVEIRSYGPRLAAEVVVDGDQIAARSTGFRRLAGYIFGGNRSRADIAMTAPVAQSGSVAPSAAGSDIAMTAPVDQAPDADGKWRVRFFMPAHYTLASLPEPLDRGVRIVTVPGQTVAVLRYAGVASAGAVRKANARLLQALAGSSWDVEGTPMAWFYDPPWTLPPLRRNEAAVVVSHHSSGN